MVKKKRCGGVGVSEYGVVLLLDGGYGGVKGESRAWFLCQSFKLFFEILSIVWDSLLRGGFYQEWGVLCFWAGAFFGFQGDWAAGHQICGH